MALARVLPHMLGRGPVDLHAADGVDCREIRARISREPVPAFGAAEVEGAAAVIMGELTGTRIDQHAADGIAEGACLVLCNGTVMVVQMTLHLVLHTPGGYIGLDIYTPTGYMSSMQVNTKTDVLKRLGKIEGQVRGLARMVEEDRYCIDVVTQIAAVRAALRRVEQAVLKDHVGHCVAHAIHSGDEAESRAKIEELMTVLARVGV
jgi:DNA-binding FrmR family transcriptional regulator